MQGAIAKLTVVAGVVAIGLLTLLQVNRGIQDSQENADVVSQDAIDDGDFLNEPDEANSSTPEPSTEVTESLPPGGQSEPDFSEMDDDPSDSAASSENAGFTEFETDRTASTGEDDQKDPFGSSTSSRSVIRVTSATSNDPLDDSAGEADTTNGEELGSFATQIKPKSTSLNDLVEFEDENAEPLDENGIDVTPSAVDDDDVRAPSDSVSTESVDDPGESIGGQSPNDEEPAFDVQSKSKTGGPSLFPDEPASASRRNVNTKSDFSNAGDDIESAEPSFSREPRRLDFEDSSSALPMNSRRSPRVGTSTENETQSKLTAELSLEEERDENRLTPVDAENGDAKSVDSEIDGDHEDSSAPIDLNSKFEVPSPSPAAPSSSSSLDIDDEAMVPDEADPENDVFSVKSGNASDTETETAIDDLNETSDAISTDSPPLLETIPARKNKSLEENLSSADPSLHGDATVDENVPQGVLRPHLTIEKVAPKHAVLGQPMIYQIIVKNLGDADAHQVVVEDRIPRGSQLSGTDPQAVLTDRKLVWNLGTLSAGREEKIAVRVVPTTEGSIGSVATVNFVAEITAETMITAPKLELELSGPKSIDVGSTLELHFKLSNTGNSTAERVFIREVIPAGFEHPAGDDLEYEVGGLSPGQSREIDLKLKAVEPGRYVNLATATAEGGWEVETKFEIDINGPQLSLTRSGPKRRAIGRTAVYSNTILNEGEHVVRDVFVEEQIPDGMDFVEASDGGQFNTKDRVVIWKIDELQPEASQTVSVVLNPLERGAMSSKVRAFDSRRIPVELSSITDVVGFPALSIDSTALDGPIDIGEDVGFRVKIRNRGTAPATNLDIRLNVPPGLKFITSRGLTVDNKTDTQVHFVPVNRLIPEKDLEFELVFKSLTPGDNRVQVELRTDEMRRPLTREEAIVVFSEEK